LSALDSHVRHPNDDDTNSANPAGNVHGGTILKMIDEAGRVAAMRHCNNVERLSKGEPALEVALARVGHMDFMSPVFIGNNTAVDARVTYASKHSMEVQVSVLAEDLLNGTRRVTNRATLWYVGIDRSSPVLQGDKDGWSSEMKPASRHTHVKPPKLVAYPVPPVVFNSVAEEEAARKRYTDQLLVRREDRIEEALALAEGRVQSSDRRTDLVQLLLPSHCSALGHVQGGVIMKLMDSAAGVSAVRFCKSNVVTASLGALNFKKPIFVGNVVTVSAWPSYTSKKTIEVSVWPCDGSLILFLAFVVCVCVCVLLCVGKVCLGRRALRSLRPCILRAALNSVSGSKTNQVAPE
jgi:acyl-coenzyme A thioesterase 7